MPCWSSHLNYCSCHLTGLPTCLTFSPVCSQHSSQSDSLKIMCYFMFFLHSQSSGHSCFLRGEASSFKESPSLLALHYLPTWYLSDFFSSQPSLHSCASSLVRLLNSETSQILFLAFAFAVPSAWDTCPPDICMANFLIPSKSLPRCPCLHKACHECLI